MLGLWRQRCRSGDTAGLQEPALEGTAELGGPRAQSLPNFAQPLPLRSIVISQDASVPDVRTARTLPAHWQLQSRPRLVRRNSLVGLPGSQPFRTLFLGQACRLLPGRLRRRVGERAEQEQEELTYEEMLALDEANPRRCVKQSVLDALQPAGKHSEECRICLHQQPGVGHVELPCRHSFCEPCTRSWLASSISCPVCRAPFPEQDTVLLHCASGNPFVAPW